MKEDRIGSPDLSGFPPADPLMTERRRTGLFAISCLPVLVASCNLALMSRVITEATLSEPSADISSPKRLTRPGFEVRFPGNWTLGAQSEELDVDHNFLIFTPKEYGLVVAHVDDKVLDPAALLEAKVEKWSSDVIGVRNRTDIPTWGAYSGTGAELRGTCGSWGETRCTARVFVFVAQQRTITIVEHVEDHWKSERGFALIEQTFRVLGPPTPIDLSAQVRREAEEDFKAGLWIEAAAKFERTYRMSDNPDLVFNMALCHRKAGNRQRALELYQQYLRLVPDSPRRPAIEGRINELQGQSSVAGPDGGVLQAPQAGVSPGF